MIGRWAVNRICVGDTIRWCGRDAEVTSVVEGKNSHALLLMLRGDGIPAKSMSYSGGEYVEVVSIASRVSPETEKGPT